MGSRSCPLTIPEPAPPARTKPPPGARLSQLWCSLPRLPPPAAQGRGAAPLAQDDARAKPVTGISQRSLGRGPTRGVHFHMVAVDFGLATPSALKHLAPGCRLCGYPGLTLKNVFGATPRRRRGCPRAGRFADHVRPHMPPRAPGNGLTHQCLPIQIKPV